MEIGIPLPFSTFPLPLFGLGPEPVEGRSAPVGVAGDEAPVEFHVYAVLRSAPQMGVVAGRPAESGGHLRIDLAIAQGLHPVHNFFRMLTRY